MKNLLNIEAYAERALEDDARARVKRQANRAARRERHLVGHNVPPTFGDLVAPGTPMRMIAHDPRYPWNS